MSVGPVGSVNAQSDDRRPGARGRVKRVLLVSGAAVCSLNLWTGGPLVAMWVGSRVEASAGHLTMGAIGAVIVTFAVVELILARILASISAAYEELIGRPRSRRRAAWLRSMRDSRPHSDERDEHMTAIDAVIVLAVVSTMVAFEVWFFFLAGSPLPQGT